MRKEEIEVLQDITRIQKQQIVLLEKAKTPQQELLQSFGQRYLVNKKMLHKNIEEALAFLEGSFTHAALYDAYLSFSLQNNIDLPPEHFPVLKLLISWTDYYPTLRSKPTLELTQAVFQGGDVSAFHSIEQLIAYINFITPDILKLLRRRESGQLSSRESDKNDRYNFDRVGTEELLGFLNVGLPKVLYNILLPNQTLSGELKKDHQTFECLFKQRQAEFFVRSKPNYGTLIRILLKGAIEKNLKSGQQRNVMELAFRYFYAFHHDKKYQATDLFIQAYNKLDESTRFSLADEFILFFRIIRKLGKGRFADFLAEKSEWVREITSKVTEKSLIGYQKQSVKPFNPVGITDSFVVGSGRKELRSFQVLEDYSLFYFKVDVVALDITIRLYYLGDVETERQGETLLIEQQKRSGEFSSSIIAVRRGIYVFQFDNSYSWINSKTIHYENILLSPLQIKSQEAYKWLPAYYHQVPTNEAAPDRVTVIQRPTERRQEKDFVGTANITKNGPFLNLKITKPNQVYEFESENEEVFVRRFNELVESAGNVRWTVNGEPLEDSDDLQDILTTKELKKKGRASAEPKQEKAQPKKVEISAEEYNSDEQESKV